MKVSTLQATNKGQLHKSNRKAIPIRLLPEQHVEILKKLQLLRFVLWDLSHYGATKLVCN